jgi:predicted ATP-grasp superfamily ATP-dependent carboligase
MFDAVRADFLDLPNVVIKTVPDNSENAFRDQAAQSDFTLVIAPEFAGLEKRCRWVEESGSRLLGPSSFAVHLTANKLELFMHFRAHGIPTPRTWLLGLEPDEFPMVWKPREGAGSAGVSLVRSEDCARRMKRNLGLLAQEYVEGFAASVAVLVGVNEHVALAPCSQRLSSDGHFQYLGGETPLPAPLAERAAALALCAVATVPGLLGYVGVDLVLGQDAAADRVIEINPRLTTSYVGLRRLADFNLADMMLRIARGERLPALKWRPDRVVFSADGTVSVSSPVTP